MDDYCVLFEVIYKIVRKNEFVQGSVEMTCLYMQLNALYDIGFHSTAHL